jgi:hypothetical protein
MIAPGATAGARAGRRAPGARARAAASVRARAPLPCARREAVVAARLARALRARIAAKDRYLAGELHRSTRLVVTSLARAARRARHERRDLLDVAAGNAARARVCLDVALRFGDLVPDDTAAACQAFDEVGRWVRRAIRASPRRSSPR